jgi:uncharacterized protein involved in exopolysaccharide biosynthesis
MEMNDRHPKSCSQQDDNFHYPALPEEEEINLLEYLLIIARNFRMIAVVCLATFILTCGATLLKPNIYTSTARILPPQQEKGGIGAMLGGMGDLAAFAGLPVRGSAGDLYVGMLESRSVSDAIIKRFNLMERFKWKYRNSAYRALGGKTDIDLGKKDGIITITVEDKDPELAAALANAYVEELMKLNVRLNLSSVGRQRQFLENRLAVVKNDLTAAEENLKAFQEQNKAIRIDDQARAIIDAIARLRGELASKEVELGVALSSQTEQNPHVKALREGIAQVRDQIRKLEQSSAGKNVSEDVFIATSDVPEMGVQYARLLREFKVQETIYELLTRQYEVAKIEEAKNTSTIQVLDPAAVPDVKSKPKRRQIVVLVTMVAGFLAVLFAFIREYVNRMNEEDRQRWDEIRGLLRLRRKS